MSYFLAVCLLLARTAGLSIQDPLPIVEGVEHKFARMNDLSADFVEDSHDLLNRDTHSTGHLSLKRPQMMRWDYESPEKYEYVSDGKFIYNYVPADKQAVKEPVRGTADIRLPLMFLLGRENLHDEFGRFEMLSTKPFLEGTKVIKMYPKRKTDLQDITMEVDPESYQIRRLIFIQTDGTHYQFTFSNIHENKGIPASFFHFVAPPGVLVVDGGR